MANGVDPNDIYHNGGWYNRNGSGPNTPITPTTSTWATRPSAAAAAGSAYLMTDVGAGQLGTGGGTLWMSNGTKWKLSNNDALIDAVDSENSSNGTTTPAQALTLAITLQSVQTSTGVVSGYVPAGYYARLRTVSTTGAPVFTYRNGQEVLM